MKRAMWAGLLGLAGVLGLSELGAAEEAAQADKGTVVEVAGLKSRTPADWKEEKPSNNLRMKQFRLPRAGEDKQDADLGISHFPGGGGSLEDNVKRWKEMFAPPEGKKIDDVFKMEKRKVGDNTLHYVDVHGTYKGSAFEKAEPKPNYRMLMAVLETKDGPYYFRLVGPYKTVAHHQKGFDEWLQGFK